MVGGKVVGASVVGDKVVGASVVGGKVVGVSVAGGKVVGASVAGGGSVVGTGTNSVKVYFIKCIMSSLCLFSKSYQLLDKDAVPYLKLHSKQMFAV